MFEGCLFIERWLIGERVLLERGIIGNMGDLLEQGAY
jgi:hypothetical protein